MIRSTAPLTISAVCIILILSPAAASAACGGFADAVNYTPVAAVHGNAAIGDLNGDDIPDVVTPSTNGTLAILIGNGNGTFAPATSYNTTLGSVARIAIDDFDNDNDNDLAVTTTGGVAILLGNDNGTFASPVTYSVTSPSWVTIGDFNEDGDADLAVVSTLNPPANSQVAILLGNGDGTFGTAVYYTVQSFAFHVALGDFNGDANVDLAVGNTLSNTVSILLGNGDGTFGTATHVPANASSRTTAVADFNADGKADLVAGNNNALISVLLGNGNGTFAAPVTYTAESYAHSVVARDFNGDGKPDVAVACRNTARVLLYVGNGDGTLATPVPHTVTSQGSSPEIMDAADLNADGRLDIALPNSESNSNIAILLGASCTDLTISKSHTGDFTQGQTGATYTVTVSNGGGASSSNTVTVTDNLPAGLTATAIAGSGWSCTLGTLTCSRSDVLAGGGSYPPITVTVNVSSTAPATVTNQATVSGVGDTDPNNNTASDLTTVIQVPELTITKTHTGNFAQGQTGRTYTLTVHNGGGGSTAGTVTVTDQLPSGLTATGMAGSGWNCDLGTLTCTRNDALAGGGSHPAITLTVTVALSAPASVVNTATVALSGEVVTTNNTASDPTTILVAPANLVALAISTTQTSLSWGAVTGATRYQVLRSSNNGPFAVIALPVTNSFNDQGLSPSTTYVYVVKSADSTNVSPASNADVATTILFTDDPITPAATLIWAVHGLELRNAVNAVRAAAGLSSASFTHTIAVGEIIHAADVTELRAALNAALAVLGISAPSYTDPALTAGDPVKRAHVDELRRAVE